MYIYKLIQSFWELGSFFVILILFKNIFFLQLLHLNVKKKKKAFLNSSTFLPKDAESKREVRTQWKEIVCVCVSVHTLPIRSICLLSHRLVKMDDTQVNGALIYGRPRDVKENGTHQTRPHSSTAPSAHCRWFWWWTDTLISPIYSRGWCTVCCDTFNHHYLCHSRPSVGSDQAG